MKILTWNINGLRAVLARAGQTLEEFLDACDGADVICFQETKLTRWEMTEALACPRGFDAFYAFSKVKRGYSGVATFVRTASMQTIDADTTSCVLQEGRIVTTVHRDFVLINVYCPTKAGDVPRKMQFHTFLTTEMERWRKLYQDKPIVLVGDLNVIHREIDACEEFTPYEATEWLEELLTESTLVDAFRHFHPTDKQAYTCWSTVTGARETNYGVRLDYIIADKLLVERSKDCWIWPKKLGSDHCPVVLQVEVPSYEEGSGEPTNVPSCAKFYPEFAGTQQTLHAFLQDASKPAAIDPLPSPQPTPKPASQPTWKQATVASFFSSKSNASAATAVQSTATAESIESIESVASIESIGQLDEYQNVAASWKSLLPGKPPPAPLCKGHKEPCVLRTVLKRNENYGRKFYLCSKPEGAVGDPMARCNHFEWVEKPRNLKRKLDDKNSNHNVKTIY